MICWACDWNNPEDTEFDYNKKSAQLIKTNNNFGLELFNEIIAADTKNIMISPASISLALGMTYNGAETTTKEAFEYVLNYEELTRTEVNEISKNLINALLVDKKGNLLEIANSIWYHLDFPVYDAFISTNKTYFDAEIRELDFSDASAVDEINKWCAKKTHDKIEEIIKELSPDSRMVLINALYFNCLWEIEFDPDETKKESFYNDDQTVYGDVDMMYTEGAFNYAITDEYTAVEMPYKDGKYSMHLILPAYGEPLSELIENLDGDTWNEWMDNYEEYDEVQVNMPKFKFDYERSIGPDLIDMGLGVAFGDQADFSSISDIALYISKVIHKTYIDVNEEGTEAAAVTSVVMDLTTVGPGGGPTIFRCDRPFLFAITENTSKSIVFIGKMMEPGYQN